MNILHRLLLLLSLIGSSAAVIAAEHVMVIESYHAQYPWDQSYLEGLRETLGDRATISTFEMDTKRLPKEQYQAQADKAWEAFLQRKPDLVVLGDDNALHYLARKIDQTGTPVVFLGINSNPRYAGLAEMHNVTGILERPLFKRNITEIKRIMGDKLKSALVLFDSGNTSQASVEGAFQNQTHMSVSGVKVKLELVAKKEQWQALILTAAEQYDAIIVGLYQTLTDAQGQNADAGEVLHWTSENSKVPLFAFWDFSVGQGKTAGGLVLAGKVQGQDAGQVVLRILNGEKPSAILPAIAQNGRFLFSKSEIERWGLVLPPAISGTATLID